MIYRSKHIFLSKYWVYSPIPRCNDHQVNIWAGQTKFGRMRAIYSDFAIRESFFNDCGDILNEILLEGLHLCQDFFHWVPEL